MAETVDSTITPTVAFVGVPGSGRRALAGAITKGKIYHLDLDSEAPQFESGAEEPPEEPLPRILVVDAPQGERLKAFAGGADDRKLARLLRSVHVLVWVESYPGAFGDDSALCLKGFRALCPGVPLVVAGSCVNRAAGLDFNGARFDVDAGSSEAERAVHAWLAELAECTSPFQPQAVLACAAVEDPAKGCNLTALSDALANALPPAARLEWQCCSLVAQSRAELAEKIILAAAAVAGGIGVAPIPVADMPFIVTTQVSLLLGLCRLYGRPLDRASARSLALAALSAVAGPMLFSTLSKLVPGLGSVIGGAVAAGCTWAVGQVAKTILESGGDFELEDFKNAVRKIYAEKMAEYSKR
ncbi:MAG: DUF697 domain-containing protein [Desulfovibrio sp.]|jgi:uncharacterized protein (DUF697 family)|nr:DUF697 domain-containing protein [Desulfovibrio sp.]MCR5170586.1 DUF697 domain-containing protein [Desulfovibrio sp.]